MIMCYNFFVGMCSRCSELIQQIYTFVLYYYYEVITMGEKIGHKL